MPDRATTAGAAARVGDLLRAAARRLQAAGVELPHLEARLLLAHALGLTPTDLYVRPEREVPPAPRAALEGLLARREAGEPVAYLTGRRGFWSLELAVSPATLIPRPETETLVEAALEGAPAGAPLRVADLGTGSGALALALARERPAWRVAAVERSPEALATADRNRRALGLEAVLLVQGDWCEALAPGAWDLVVANPPYVAEGDPHLARGDLRFEPPAALAAGPEGLDALRRLAERAPSCLAPGGRLLLEHGADQGPAVRALLAAAGLAEVGTRRDPGGRPRVTGGRRPA
jgi:release factor glutamine methyltransferase